MTVYVPDTVPVALRPKVRSIVGPLTTFAKLHKVQDKDTKALIHLNPLPMQERIFAAVEAGNNRIAVVKARQVAATTGCKMVLHHMAYPSPNAAMHALVSMREDSATALLDDNKRWLLDLPSLLTRPIENQGRTRIRYGDTGAEIKSFTSRSTTGLRSFQPSAAVISEAAYAPDLAETIAQADAAVGNGLLIIESTANTPGDHFDKIIQGAPENGWHVITLWWWEHPAYRSEDDLIDSEFALTEDEIRLRDHHGLSVNQLHWRRLKVLQIGEHKFRREYPATLGDCFLGREGGYYGEELLGDIQVLDFQTGRREVEKPHPGDAYVIGVDVGGGVGGDYSTISVISVSTLQPVYSERSNQMTPSQWAHRVIQVATRYNGAMVLAESNNHGHALILEMDSCGYRHQWRDPKGKPWVTTLKSKIDAFDTLREHLKIIKVMDRVTWMELRSLTIPPGKAAPEAPKGAYDDCAMALALAYRCLRDIPSRMRTYAMPSVSTRIDSLISKARAKRIRSNNLPF